MQAEATRVKTIGRWGIAGVVLGCLLSALRILIWSKGLITPQVVTFAAAGALVAGLFACVLAGGRKRRNWDRFGMWFAAFCLLYFLLDQRARIGW